VTQSDPLPAETGEWTGFVMRITGKAAVDEQKMRAVLQSIEDVDTVDLLLPPSASSSTSAAAITPSSTISAAGQNLATIRIPAKTLENFLENVGEILLDQARLAHQWEQNYKVREEEGSTDYIAHKEELFSTLDHLKRLALNLQETILGARMLPLNTLFRTYPRAVHDMAKKLNKSIRLEIYGGETELDRLVMDRLNEPLMHLLRNACDHGLESTAIRQKNGKAAEGVIRLEAFTAQGHVHIQLSDDGAGIDWDKLREKAVQLHLMSPEAATAASTDELTPLLFRSGLSTSEKVTDLSGRGVGLDVVQSVIEQLHGVISLQSIPQHGTTFHLELPMTMAIVSSLL
ncbi:MAG: ATP-binding protein, partial [Firmicutes bacterium]|nr:ATP-binding protein [Bacillota bacterium]